MAAFGGCWGFIKLRIWLAGESRHFQKQCVWYVSHQAPRGSVRWLLCIEPVNIFWIVVFHSFQHDVAGRCIVGHVRSN